MKLLPTLNTRTGNFYFEWLIFHVWTLDTIGLSVEADISSVRIGIGCTIPYLRIWIGLPIAPYWFYQMASVFDRNTDAQGSDEYEDIIPNDGVDDE